MVSLWKETVNSLGGSRLNIMHGVIHLDDLTTQALYEGTDVELLPKEHSRHKQIKTNEAKERIKS
jgi:hypothetical protein